MISRRGFFGLIVGLFVASKAVIAAPTNEVPAWPELQRIMSERFNMALRGLKRMPQVMKVSREVFDTYEANLITVDRFSGSEVAVPDGGSLKFKSVTMISMENFTGMYMEIG